MLVFPKFARLYARALVRVFACMVLVCTAAQSASAYQITVRTITGTALILEVNGTDTIASVKAKIEIAQGTPVALQRLIFTPGVLDDALTLDSYAIGSDTTIFLLISRPPPPPPKPIENTDSQDVRALQIAASRAVAIGSGQAIAAAVTGALDDRCPSNSACQGSGGLTGAPPAGGPSGLGAATLSGRSHLGLGPADSGLDEASSQAWHTWGTVKGLDFDRATGGGANTGSRLVNVTAGADVRVGRNVIIGALAGYEDFDSTAHSLDGKLSGDGWTGGGYAAWTFLPGLRADAMGAYSKLNYEAHVRTASGAFDADRWLASGGVTGSYALGAALMLQPSARVFIVSENQDAWTDSRGTRQAARDFSAGRASLGAKLSQTWPVTAELALTPYAGVYADYYFGSDDEVPVTLEGLGLSDGWSARGLIGLTAQWSTGPRLSIEGEYGSLGDDGTLLTWSARGTVPF